MSHTYATLPVSKSAYNEIMAKMEDAGYEENIEEGVIDMHGIALVVEETEEQTED